MRRFLSFVICIFFGIGLIPTVVQAQAIRIVGAVYDATTGLPLRARVVMQPGGQAATTDAQGNYTFSRVRAGNYTLSVNVSGYDPATKTVTVKTSDVLADIGLRPIGGVNLADVPNKPRETANPDLRPAAPPQNQTPLSQDPSPAPRTMPLGPVFPINPPDLHYTHLAQRIQAACPDVWIAPTSGNQSSGLFMTFRNGGGLTSIASPLIFVDGIRLENEEYRFLELGGQGVSALTDLKPEDLQDVTCLSGPAASARWGVSAGAGVILLTTRAGTVGKTQANYHVEIGQNQIATPFDFSTASNPEAANDGLRTGAIVRHGLRFEGGQAQTQYYANGYVGRADGAVLNDGLRERGARLHLTTTPFSTLQLTATLSHAQAETGSPQGGTSVYGYLLNTTGTAKAYGLADSSLIRRFTTLHEHRRTLAHFGAKLEPLPNLFITGKMGYEGTDLQGEQNRPPNALVGIGLVRRSVISRKSAAFSYEAALRYVWNKNNRLSATTEAGIRAFDLNAYQLLIAKDGFTEEDPTDVGTGRDLVTNEEVRSGQREMGIFVQEDLVWKSGMKLQLGLTVEDADRIGQEAGFSYLPFARFVLPLYFSFLPESRNEVFLAFGKAGNLPNALDAKGTFWISVPGGFGNGWVVASAGNKNLKPEQIREWEAGIKSKWAQKLDFSASTYWQQTTDAVVYALPTPSSGLGKVLLPQNGGESVGYGVLAKLNYAMFQSTEYGVWLALGLHGQQNRVTTLNDVPDMYDGNKLNVIKPGFSRLAFYAPVVVGAEFDATTQKYLRPILASAGTTYNGKTVDENGNAFLGNAQPAWLGMAEVKAQWRNWQIAATFDGAQGASVYNGSRHFRVNAGGDQAVNIARAQIGLLTRNDVTPFLPGTEAYQNASRLVALSDPNYAGNFVERADFLRFSLLQIRYHNERLPIKRGEGHLKRFSLGLSITNLSILTRYSGLDPTVRTLGTRTFSWGQERFTMPQNRTILFSAGLGL